MEERAIILFGAGSLALEVAQYIADVGAERTGVHVSDVVSEPEASPDVVEFLGEQAKFHRSRHAVENVADKHWVICVGDSFQRERILAELETGGRAFKLATIIHPSAYIARTARVEAGAIVAPFGFVGPQAVVGRNALVNVHATIGHHAQLGESAVVSPHGVMNGHSECGRASFLGAGAVLTPSAKLASYSKLSAGSVLNGAADEGFLLHGNPAKGRRMFKPL